MKNKNEVKLSDIKQDCEEKSLNETRAQRFEEPILDGSLK